MTRAIDGSPTMKHTDKRPAYRDPDEIMRDTRLSPSAKRRALESWAFAIRGRVDAYSDGASDRDERAYKDDMAMLQRLERLLDADSAERARTGGRGRATPAGTAPSGPPSSDNKPTTEHFTPDKRTVISPVEARQGWIGTGRIFVVLLASMSLAVAAGVALWVLSSQWL